MKSKSQKNSIKVNMAVLGGGDVVFPIITSGVFYRNFGLIPSLSIMIGATLGLSYILFFGEKKKPYPAMPFITAGILLGLLLWGIFFKNSIV
jgi:presenilin-like A22 family membrane protease